MLKWKNENEGSLLGSFQETAQYGEIIVLAVSGLAVEDIAEHLGVRPVSAATYVKRLYRKLGVNGLRELFGLTTQAQWALS